MPEQIKKHFLAAPPGTAMITGSFPLTGSLAELQ
jgi:hypothetical protein